MANEGNSHGKPNEDSVIEAFIVAVKETSHDPPSSSTWRLSIHPPAVPPWMM
jgi:hypothetical protein